MKDSKSYFSCFKFEPNRYRKQKLEIAEAVSILKSEEPTIVIDPESGTSDIMSKGVDVYGSRS